MDLEEIKVLYSQEEIAARIEELAKEITGRYSGKELILLGIIKGALPFFMKLAPKIELPQMWDFMALSSYGDRTETTGILKINMDLASSITGKDVLIVEDIVDTGLTMDFLIAHLKARRPASIRICTLLFKEERLKKKLKVDFVGFKIPNRFVVGFGLDHAERYRELPYIGYFER